MYATSGPHPTNTAPPEVAAPLVFDQVVFQSTSFGDNLYAPATSTFTAPRAGTYFCGVGAQLITSSGVGLYVLRDTHTPGHADAIELVVARRGSETGGTDQPEGVSTAAVVTLMPDEKIEAKPSAASPKHIAYAKFTSQRRGISQFWCFLISPGRSLFEWTQAPVVNNWAGSGRYRKGPRQNPRRIFVVQVFLLALLVVVCCYVSSRTWDSG